MKKTFITLSLGIIASFGFSAFAQTAQNNNAPGCPAECAPETCAVPDCNPAQCAPETCGVPTCNPGPCAPETCAVPDCNPAPCFQGNGCAPATRCEFGKGHRKGHHGHGPRGDFRNGNRPEYNPFAGIALTPDQQKKIDKLQADRKSKAQKAKAKQDKQRKADFKERKAQHDKYVSELKKILTPEQFTQFENNHKTRKASAPKGKFGAKKQKFGKAAKAKAFDKRNVKAVKAEKAIKAVKAEKI